MSIYSHRDEDEILQSLTTLRKSRGLTQKQVEEQLGLRSSTIYDYESGRLKLPVDFAIKLSNLYDCSLEDLLGLKTKNEKGETQSSQIFSLASLGLIGGKHKMFSNDVFKDPIILAEVGETEVEMTKSAFELLIAGFTDTQQKAFAIELLKYVNSLIGIDQKVTKEEIQLRETLIEDLPFELSESEVLSIRKALSKEYFGKSIEKRFPRRALKHFTLWTLFIIGISDGELDHRESEYIESVATHLGIKKKDYEFIKKNIETTWSLLDR